MHRVRYLLLYVVNIGRSWRRFLDSQGRYELIEPSLDRTIKRRVTLGRGMIWRSSLKKQDNNTSDRPANVHARNGRDGHGLERRAEISEM